MKTIIKIFLLISLFFSWFSAYAINNCKYDEANTDLSTFLDNCKPVKLAWTWSYEVESGFKWLVNWWIANISLLLWIIAVWMLVYAWLLMQLSAWEDEKIKKAKDIIKWTIIWFLWLISASSIIYIVVNLVFNLAWN